MAVVRPVHALFLNAYDTPAPGMEAAAHRTRGRTAAWAAEAATVGADPVRAADVGRGDGGYSGHPGDTPSRKGNCGTRGFWGGRRPIYLISR
ncbi:MAG: hypothetical protein JJU02_02335 [Cryomorphaceae bacterium]|nr:hypothetical protein [Cryomorphaceae bacterium]